MKVSEAIKQLEELKESRGDLELFVVKKARWYEDLRIQFVANSGLWDEHIAIEGCKEIFW